MSVSTAELYRAGLALMTVWALVTLVIVSSIRAPYGRHARAGWGPTMPARWAWVLFEAPAVLLFAALTLSPPARPGVAASALIALWLAHYLHRAFIWPFRAKGGRKPMPLVVVGAAIAFQLLNTWLNGTWIGRLGAYPLGWLSDPRFIIGVSLFVAGFALNLWADAVLLRLRGPGEVGYKIPRGGLYGWISCPNYLGELLEWAGWALASWSWAGAAFAIYTAINLVPRALAHHRWYRERFPSYPPERRAIIPWLL